MRNKPRVLVADDHAEMLSALKRLLDPACDVVGLAATGGALIEEARRLQPDVAVVDLNLAGFDGFEVCRRLVQAMPNVKVVILTAADDPELRERARTAGASFVSKYSAAHELVPAIEKAWKQAS